MGKDPPERIALQIFEQIRRPEAIFGSFRLRAGTRIRGLRYTIIYYIGQIDFYCTIMYYKSA